MKVPPIFFSYSLDNDGAWIIKGYEDGELTFSQPFTDLGEALSAGKKWEAKTKATRGTIMPTKHPILFALIWVILSGRDPSQHDLKLATLLYKSPDWFLLNTAERQWVEMLLGSNLDEPKSAHDVLFDELSELGIFFLEDIK